VDKMIDRIALALFETGRDAVGLSGGWDDLPPKMRVGFRLRAVAVLTVMRDPTGELLEAIHRNSSVESWRDMIDAVLQEVE
jgi:hypothetical protein